MYWASTDKVITTVKDVELLKVTEVASYQIPVDGFKNSTFGILSKLAPVTVIVASVLSIVSGEILEIVGFVSATPVRFEPSIAGNVAGNTASVSFAEPSSLAS